MLVNLFEPSDLAKYFLLLPFHPKPEPGESFNSYLTRLAILNKFRYYLTICNNLLPQMIGKTVKKLQDIPPLSISRLALVTNVSEEDILATTFFYLVKNFSRSTKPQNISRFLSGAVSKNLRYCPSCLDEHKYYRLSWRFFMVEGCAQHNCYLLENCGNCGQPIPLFYPFCEIGICPACGKDLRSCVSPVYPEERRESLNEDLYALEILLKEKGGSFDIGKRLRTIRFHQSLSQKELAKLSGVFPGTVSSIEKGEGTFLDLLSCIKSLGLSLRSSIIEPNGVPISQCEPLNVINLKSVREDFNADDLRQKVLTAIKDLEEGGGVARVCDIERLLKVKYNVLYKWKKVRMILPGWNQEKERKRQLKEAKILQILKATREEMLKNAQITPISEIFARAGIKMGYHHMYEGVSEWCRQVAKDNKQIIFGINEVEFIRHLDETYKALLGSEKRITRSELLFIANIPTSSLQIHPNVNKKLDEICLKLKVEDFSIPQGEEALLQNVFAVIWQLYGAHQRITQVSVARELHLSVAALRKYPKIRVVFNDIARSTKRGKSYVPEP
jgi:transcriptional regulator with XRE-family HTH domain